jgi:uncharacterized membrane protein YqgA involved in biofilm formation
MVYVSIMLTVILILISAVFGLLIGLMYRLQKAVDEVKKLIER